MKTLITILLAVMLVGCSMGVVEAQYYHYSYSYQVEILSVDPVYMYRGRPYSSVERCYRTPPHNRLSRIEGYRYYRKGRLYCYRLDSPYRQVTQYRVTYWNPIQDRVDVIHYHKPPHHIVINRRGAIIEIR